MQKVFIDSFFIQISYNINFEGLCSNFVEFFVLNNFRGLWEENEKKIGTGFFHIRKIFVSNY